MLAKMCVLKISPTGESAGECWLLPLEKANGTLISMPSTLLYKCQELVCFSGLCSNVSQLKLITVIL